MLRDERRQRLTATQGGGIHMVTPTEDYYSDHDGGKFAPMEATTVATWKARPFLENLTVDAEGAVFVTVYSHKRVDRYDPATGATTTFAEVPAPPMGNRHRRQRQRVGG
jgi:hypothetical protein